MRALSAPAGKSRSVLTWGCQHDLHGPIRAYCWAIAIIAAAALCGQAPWRLGRAGPAARPTVLGTADVVVDGGVRSGGAGFADGVDDAGHAGDQPLSASVVGEHTLLMFGQGHHVTLPAAAAGDLDHAHTQGCGRRRPEHRAEDRVVRRWAARKSPLARASGRCSRLRNRSEPTGDAAHVRTRHRANLVAGKGLAQGRPCRRRLPGTTPLAGVVLRRLRAGWTSSPRRQGKATPTGRSAE